ncbi:prolipoprotein diacylglyceryl transferase [Spiroplasma sabaudiense Ar-1343]|uniref:Prolipoprotein diacylglyceryl transferase n=1 Tax=Spiroplasma sabaudiense Ar-1343 TaxID=1276257 RepID=W6A8Y5_9MOLU|nr:prolipoprotein diacylglyceryl transferase family protein [Spiroplasma sabaudiense]AHI53477.1 prolipoprotein diacylglyceryl transferase [Spiroplasma sabaudiense Ar-1343]
MITNLLANIPAPGTPIDDFLKNQAQNDRFWGWMPIYPLFIFAGVIAVLIASIIKFRMRNIPLQELGMSIFIIIPTGLVGASVLGKFDLLYNNWRVWELLFFWQPGMSIFGGLIFGGACGFAWFYKKGQHYRISTWVYADCIIPNVFLGQAIGRWGNLFNHEIMGRETSLKSLLKWLPDWIVSKLWYPINPSPDALPTDQWYVIYREPLFLYESIGCFALFILTTFFIANLGRFFSKKPWKIYPKDYPYNKWVNQDNIEISDYQRPIRYRKKTKNGIEMLSIGFWESWNKAYYLKMLDKDQIIYFTNKEIEIDKNFQSKVTQLEKIKSNKSLSLQTLNNSFAKQVKKITTKDEKKALKKSKKIEEKKIIKEYQPKIKSLKSELSWFSRCWKADSRELYQANNPNNYFIVHCGTQTGFYLFSYMVLRWVLETRRTDVELVIKHYFVADMLLFALFALFALFFIVFAQVISPKKYRKIDWLYEKSY